MVGLPYRGKQTNRPHQTGSRAQIQSPCLKCLRAKLRNLQTISQTNKITEEQVHDTCVRIHFL